MRTLIRRVVAGSCRLGADFDKGFSNESVYAGVLAQALARVEEEEGPGVKVPLGSIAIKHKDVVDAIADEIRDALRQYVSSAVLRPQLIRVRYLLV